MTMKRKLTLKSLLVAALVGMGTMSAWAGEINATLVHTASSFCSGDANAYTSTLDAAKEHVNNAAFKGAWQGAAYAEFEVTLPEGESITSAVLKFMSYGEERRERNCDIMVVNAGESIDYDAVATGTAKLDLPASTIASKNFAQGAAAEREFTIEVKDAVKTIVDAGQTYIIFKFTNNPGGGDIAGKGSGAAPTLVITTASASTQTTYTVVFTDGSNELKEPAVYDGTIGELANASETDMSNFKNEDGTTKYIYVSGAEEITLDANAENNVITLVFREAQVVNYGLEDVTTGTVLVDATAFENEDVVAYYPHYILSEGELYECPKQGENPWYGISMNVGTSGALESVEYTKTTIPGIVYYTEGENIPGISVNSSVNYTDIRSFGGAVGYATEDITLTTLQPGKYIIKADLFTPTSAQGSQTIMVGSEEFALISPNNGYHNEVETVEFDLPVAADVVLKAGGGNTNAIDWLYIQNVPDKLNYVVNAVDEYDNVLFEIGNGWVYEGGTASVFYPAFYLKDGELLQANRVSADGKSYQFTFDVPADGTTFDVVYKSVGLNDVEFYAEAEDIEGLTAVSSGNAPVRCSGGKGAFAEENTKIVTLEPGLYTISGFAWGNAGTDFNVLAGDNIVATFSTVSATLSINTSSVFELTEETDLVLEAQGNGGSSPKVIDYLFVQKVPAAITIEMSSDYETFSSKYPLDFSTVTGVKAYYATEAANDKVVMAPVNGAVNAMEGLFLQKIENGGIAIPVAGQGDVLEGNLLKAGNGSKVAASDETVKHYVLGDQDGIGFYNLADEVVVPEGKAYLEFNVEISTARLAIVFGNEATGISELKAEKNAETIYNLAGQRVVKAQKGLYIQNGMKYMVK